ncbi:hypothetical protein STRIP9103_03375 [Streptomyces ipomoeae 91-03]|uniref:Uncharacterized protein n=1 Tax=Streptomyces ipomoeae 91-03 TaxID=698759 RepID=L1L676_9ACTN|nr:hypothetical protein STRIP9103_03375 [Streptomyces ipomoeae 91-03]
MGEPSVVRPEPSPNRERTAGGRRACRPPPRSRLPRPRAMRLTWAV